MSPHKLQILLQEGIGHHRAGRFAEAEQRYRRARGAAPRNFDALHLSGLVAYQQGRIEEAVDLLGRAHRLDRRHAVCAMRLGLAVLAAGRPAEAEGHLREAVAARPDLHEGWDNLAYCLKAQDRLQEAVPLHQRCVELKPSYAVGWYNYGLTLILLGRVLDALTCHERALAVDPGYAMARYGRALALHQGDRLDEAIEDYGRFLALRPNHHEARSFRLFALQNLPGVTREELFAEHVAFGRAVGAFPPPALPNPPDAARRLRVAILSPDLRAHSCAFFLEPLLQHLDRAQFELLLYHDHFREDAVSARLKSLASKWRNLVGQPSPAVEKIIRADAPDLLIDLAGHTGLSSRLPLYARRLAPVQITYLGYPDTTGLPAMDFRFTDAHADPPGDADRFATERLVRFAPTAWAYAPPPEAPPVGPSPAARGAPITFGCFNNPTKITDPLLALWGRLLQAVPGSRLVLKGRGFGNDGQRARYRERFARAGLPAERVDLLERTADTTSHLALYHGIDVALDSFPYHGTTTTCEALWMGVPVVTRAGDRHASRVGVSLLHAAGHPEWAAASEDDYVRIAAHLATDVPRLATLRTGLRDELRRGPLLDHAGQAGRFGAALRDCWRAWCARPAVANGSAGFDRVPISSAEGVSPHR